VSATCPFTGSAKENAIRVARPKARLFIVVTLSLPELKIECDWSRVVFGPARPEAQAIIKVHAEAVHRETKQISGQRPDKVNRIHI
jgi:hypothetical protein